MAGMTTSTTKAANDTITSTQNNAIRKDIIQMAGDYATSAGSANAQTLAIDSSISAYSEGQKFRFKAGYTNTAACTLNVNSIGAKTIKKTGGSEDLLYGEILAGGIYEIEYDGTNFNILNPTLIAGAIALTAGENLTANDAVYVSDGSEFNEYKTAPNGASNQISPTTKWFATMFTSGASDTKLKKVMLYSLGYNTGGGAGTEQFTLSLRATSGGLPTGADLTSVTSTIGGNSQQSAAQGANTVVFDFSNYSISPSTQYALILRSNTQYASFYSANSGDSRSSVSTDSGATWAAASNSYEMALRIQLGITTTSGNVYKTRADKSDIRGKAIGFVVNTVTATGVAKIQTENIVTLTGLTAGSDYYLSDTPGAISTTKGTIPRKIGKALTTTLFNFEPEQKRFIKIQAPGTFTISGGDSVWITFDVVNYRTYITPAAKSILIQQMTSNSLSPVSLRTNSSDTIASPVSQIYGDVLELELDSNNLFQAQCQGYVSHNPFFVSGYYI